MSETPGVQPVNPRVIPERSIFDLRPGSAGAIRIPIDGGRETHFCLCCVKKICVIMKALPKVRIVRDGNRLIEEVYCPFEIVWWFSMLGSGLVVPCELQFWESANQRPANYDRWKPGEWNPAHAQKEGKRILVNPFEAMMERACSDGLDGGGDAGNIYKFSFTDRIGVPIRKGMTEAFLQHFAFCSAVDLCPIGCVDIYVVHVIRRDGEGKPSWDAYIAHSGAARSGKRRSAPRTVADMIKLYPELVKNKKAALENKKERCVP